MSCLALALLPSQCSRPPPVRRPPEKDTWRKIYSCKWTFDSYIKIIFILFFFFAREENCLSYLYRVFSDVNKQKLPEFLTLPRPVPALCRSPGDGVPWKAGFRVLFPAGGRVLLPEVGPATPASAQVRGPGLPGAGVAAQGPR